MSKGFFTQTVCVLLEAPVSLQQLEHVLAAYQIRGKHAQTESWPFGGPSLTLSYQPEVNGYVAVDLVDQLWPDHVGDPKQDPPLFGA